jgi:hypothetical protein
MNVFNINHKVHFEALETKWLCIFMLSATYLRVTDIPVRDVSIYKNGLLVSVYVIVKFYVWC